MKPDHQDNADPEVGPASDPLRISTKSNSEETSHQPTTSVKTIIRPEPPPLEVNKDELIPLTHAPPPPSSSLPPPPQTSAVAVAVAVVEEKPSSNSNSNSNGGSQTQTAAAAVAKKKAPNIRLIHPFLLKIPMQIRYAVYGAVSSALFMIMYNTAVEKLGHLYVPSTLYAATYLIFIPIQHAMAATMVFGWPDRYLPSLTSNVPIGLTAIALGSYLTAYLDQIDFNQSVESLLVTMGLIAAQNAAGAGGPGGDDNKPPTKATNNNSSSSSSSNEFYTSFFVLVVTSLWSFLLSVLVNAPAETPDKKEL